MAEHPLRERLHAQRMLALYRCGRQAEALDAYRQARSVLVEEIGVEPGPELRRLHEAILRQDPALDPPAADAVELPPELDAGTPLAGREAELDALREQWRRARSGAGRLVLVVGRARDGQDAVGGGARAAKCIATAARCSTPPGRARRRRRSRRWRALGSCGARRCWCSTTSTAQVRRRGRRSASWSARWRRCRCSWWPRPRMPVCASGLRADATIVLAPLDADGVRAVARLYAGEREDADVPVERLAEASGGVPQRLHRAAGEWARTLARSAA